MPSFYNHQLDLESQHISLSPEESQHAIKARRLRVGDRVSVINGRGITALCSLETLDRSAASLMVESIEFTHAPPLKLSIASALPKGDRMRTMIDMLAQLGTSRFVPLRCAHSVQKCSTSMLSKLQRYALEACKQSNNPWLMHIDQEHSVGELLETAGKEESALAYADGMGGSLADRQFLSHDLCVAIGPEGGFSPDEVTAFAIAQAPAIKLGSTILRTETAAVAVAAQWIAR